MRVVVLTDGGQFPSARDRLSGATVPTPAGGPTETAPLPARRHRVADHADDAAGARGPEFAGTAVVPGAENSVLDGVCCVARIPTDGQPGAAVLARLEGYPTRKHEPPPGHQLIC